MFKKIFLNFKNFVKKIAKNGFLSIFFQKIKQTKHSLFERLDEKRNLQEIFEKIFEKFLKKIAKNALFWHIFQELNKPWVNFSRVWTKNASCWKFLRKFS